MSTYVAFLRAINVAGHGSIRMEALKRAFDRAGCGAVRTYIQSGNVVFDCGAEGVEAVCRKIDTNVRALVDGQPTIIYRTLGDLERLIRANPFKGLADDSTKKLYVTFLAETPKKKVTFPVVSQPEVLEALGMKKLDVFIVSGRKKNGFYGFPNNFIEKELGVAGTSRNWSTVTKIVAFAKTAAGRSA